MTWLLILARVKSALSAAFGWIRANPSPALVIALSVALAWTWHTKNAALARIAAMETAQKSATVAQVAVNHEPARKSGIIARTSDDEAPAYYASVSRAAADHAVRVRGTVPSGNPGVRGADSSEPSVHGPAAAADLVCRPEADDAQIVAAAGRAAKMHQDSLDLIASGVAVASSDEEAH